MFYLNNDEVFLLEEVLLDPPQKNQHQEMEGRRGAKLPKHVHRAILNAPVTPDEVSKNMCDWLTREYEPLSKIGWLLLLCGKEFLVVVLLFFFVFLSVLQQFSAMCIIS